MPANKKKILFLCVANSARSQMAEGLARSILGDAVEVYSAGSLATQVHRLSKEVMSEIGIDISNQYSKSVDTFKGEDFDYVITLCNEEVCPAWVGGQAQRLHWGLTDPAKGHTHQEQAQTFRTIRDELKVLIQSFFG